MSGSHLCIPRNETFTCSVPKKDCRTETQQKVICFQLVLLWVSSVPFKYPLSVVGDRLSGVGIDLRLSVVAVSYWLSGVIACSCCWFLVWVSVARCWLWVVCVGCQVLVVGRLIVCAGCRAFSPWSRPSSGDRQMLMGGGGEVWRSLIGIQVKVSWRSFGVMARGWPLHSQDLRI
jgi:hypothetical protein